VLDYLNVQGQPMYRWPATYSLAKAYVDQLDRDPAVSEAMIRQLREGISTAETSGNKAILMNLAGTVTANATGTHAAKMSKLASTLEALAKQ